MEFKLFIFEEDEIGLNLNRELDTSVRFLFIPKTIIVIMIIKSILKITFLIEELFG